MSYSGHSLGVGGHTPLQRCNQCILQPKPTGQGETWTSKMKISKKFYLTRPYKQTKIMQPQGSTETLNRSYSVESMNIEANRIIANLNLIYIRYIRYIYGSWPSKKQTLVKQSLSTTLSVTWFTNSFKNRTIYLQINRLQIIHTHIYIYNKTWH